MRIAKRSLILLLAIAGGCGGGVINQPASVPAPDQQVRAGATQEVTLQGRMFRLTVLDADINGTRTYALEILGDRIMVSFAAQTPPHDPTISGDTVTFGGHTFQVTAQANAYVVDGQAQTLDPGGVYLFNDGRFVARRR